MIIQWYPFTFLRHSLGLPVKTLPSLSESDWLSLHQWAIKQSLVGVLYYGIQGLPAEQKPPRHLALRWSMEAEHIRGLNKKVDEVSARLTKLFEEQDARSFILKGSANALLYPDPSLRQTGDVDIWVEDGRKKVVELLGKMGLMKKASISSLHVHLDDALFGMDVEVHFIATRQYAPSQNAALQQFLVGETSNATLAPAGFYVPSTAYALMMQLSHIKQHLFKGGVGLRQLVDYHQLLRHSSDGDRAKVATLLHSCGLDKMAAAVMFALGEVLELDESLMLCKPDARRGKFLLKVALDGGNFGWYAEDYKGPVIARWFKDRVRFFRLLPFDSNESLWREIKYWIKTISLIPRRIKQRRLALGNR